MLKILIIIFRQIAQHTLLPLPLFFISTTLLAMKAIEIHWTAASQKEARTIATICCRKRLAACVQIGPEIESHYIWKGKIEKAKEVKVVFKTTRSHFTKVKKTILENCSYEIPEIVAVSIIDGHVPYLKWIEESVTHLP